MLLRETVTLLMRSCLAKRCVFKSRLKRSDSMARSCTNQAVIFKPLGWRLRKPGWQMCCNETAEYSVCDGWPNRDVGGQKLRRLAHSCQQGTLQLGTEDTDEQSRQAFTSPAVE